MEAKRPFTIPPGAFALPAALLLCASLSGCLIGSSSRTEHTGIYVSEKTLAQIQPGKDKSYVIALIGDPETKHTLDDGSELWKWSYSEEKTSRGSVIFLISSNKTVATKRATFVEFRDSKVVKAWTD